MDRRTLRWLKRPPVEWDKAVTPAIEQRERRAPVEAVISDLEHLAQWAAMLAEYLETRLGTDGCGTKEHADAVKAANHTLVKVRKALGYSYPQHGTFTF